MDIQNQQMDNLEVIEIVKKFPILLDAIAADSILFSKKIEELKTPIRKECIKQTIETFKSKLDELWNLIDAQ